MFKLRYTLILFFIIANLFAQENKDKTIKEEINISENDTVFKDTIVLEEVHLYKEKLDPEALKQFQLLRNRVYVVYPYARTAAEKLTAINNTMSKLSEKEKKRYFKIADDYLNNEFKEKLKKLSRKQGQILVKLINRQTGSTTYDLIKDYKSGWKAFWSSNTARLFDINLKEKYEPFNNNEDFLIETILNRAFAQYRLIEQKPFTPINLEQLTDHWQKLAVELSKKDKTN